MSQTSIQLQGETLHLLPDKAIYLEQANSLLLCDVHLGKADTFQSFGIPIPLGVNDSILMRLKALCTACGGAQGKRYSPEFLFILGDLFHSKFAMNEELLTAWQRFLESTDTEVHLLLGNHDRHLLRSLSHLPMQITTDNIHLGGFLLSHEPSPSPGRVNICGHVHPCFCMGSKLDRLRLPCFYFDRAEQVLMLPSFGEFTGGYEVPMGQGATAYVIAEDAVVPFG
jgi:uncharacterized protein